jgi:hypothetical protein
MNILPNDVWNIIYQKSYELTVYTRLKNGWTEIHENIKFVGKSIETHNICTDIESRNICYFVKLIMYDKIRIKILF